MMRGISAETFSGYKQRENSIAWNKPALRAKTIQNLGVTAAVLEVSQSVFCSERPLTPTAAAPEPRSGFGVRARRAALPVLVNLPMHKRPNLLQLAQHTEMENSTKVWERCFPFESGVKASHE